MSDLFEQYFGEVPITNKRRVFGEMPVPYRHMNSTVNESISLCQEFSMRTGAYDEKALVRISVFTSSVTFHKLVEVYGLDEAVMRVDSCYWLATDEFWNGTANVPCPDCLEVRYA